jgi:hypothetical protein
MSLGLSPHLLNSGKNAIVERGKEVKKEKGNSHQTVKKDEFHEAVPAKKTVTKKVNITLIGKQMPVKK